jgi:glycosyltransferase involved in cell wall biosynthesis
VPDQQEPISPDLTVLIATYNRAAGLHTLLESVLAQETGAFRFEVIVVDNNSSDHTRDVVAELASTGRIPLRYLFEAEQGRSEALNTGLDAVRAPIVATIDDDQIMPPGYLAVLLRAFHENPEVAFVGGKVLPIWEQEPPHWLTPAHWSPLAMADYGDVPFLVGAHRPICLLTCSFRTADLRAAGGFQPGLAVTGRDQIGGQEDAEMQERLWRAGRPGLYDPALVLHHHAPALRLTREYHLRWHRGHGRFSALRREERIERSRAHLFGVPAHLYRGAASAACGWIAASVRGSAARAFRHRTRLAYFRGFLEQRFAQRRAQRAHTTTPSLGQSAADPPRIPQPR